MKQLIINADDFGLTSGVNRAIIELHQTGVLTSTTLMANAAATQEAVQFGLANPSLGIGCHVVLVDGVPILPAAKLPTLVDQSTGRFRATLGKFVKDLAMGRIQPTEIAAEAEAQISHLRSLGLTPTHLDTHKHTHMFPRVLNPVLQAALRQGVPAIRNPFEPDWSLAATAGTPTLRRLQVKVLNRFQPEFLRQVAQAGLATTNGTVGVLATGTLDSATLTSLLSALPEGTWELVTHPGYNDPDLASAGTRLLASREIERTTLKNADFGSDIKLIHFGNLN